MRWAWIGALGCFVLAGLTGALYRFGLGYGFTLGFDLVNVRHAHSHLMYLGWVTPALFALIIRQLPALTGQAFSPKGRWVIGATFAMALLAYPLFLAFGYRSVALGEVRVPLAAIAASLNMLVWYVFVAFYVRATRGVQRTRAILLWDMALTFLVVATLGAWGLALLEPLGIDDPMWVIALKHVFLDLFSEGWFVLATLGAAYAVLAPSSPKAGHWSLWLICAGLPVIFALGMPESLISPPMKVLARLGGVLVAGGLLVQVGMLWPMIPNERSWLWRVPLVLLTLKLLAQLAVSIVPGVWWADMQGLRIFYLHLMLLGFVTLGLVAAASRVWGSSATRGLGWLYAAVLLVFGSLLPFTTLWPSAWSGTWAWSTAAWVALGPALVAFVMAGKGIYRPTGSVVAQQEGEGDGSA